MGGFSIGPLLGPDRPRPLWECIAAWIFGPPKFKPCVIYHDEIRMTELLLEDTAIVWRPWGLYKGHAVDCGYSFDGRLVGIQIWDDVRTR